MTSSPVRLSANDSTDLRPGNHEADEGPEGAGRARAADQSIFRVA